MIPQNENICQIEHIHFALYATNENKQLIIII